MSGDRRTKDPPDAVSLWRSLRDLLEVEIDVDAPEPATPSSQVTVKATVTNATPDDPDWPEIVFEGVSLSFNVDKQRQSTNMGRLESGGSASHEFTCRFSDLPGLEVGVAGSVDHHKFFRMELSHKIGLAHTRPTALAFVNSFDELSVHQPLESAAQAIQGLGADTPLSSIHSASSDLTRAASDAAQLQDGLNEVSRSLGGSGPPFRELLRAAHRYLGEVSERCEAMKSSFASSSQEDIEEARVQLLGLRDLAAQIDVQIDRLKIQFDISH